ncbi:TIGR02301 family protein [Methylocapsa acidiphila]|uniref:TIGR02301 family protein n=1 Tax=Methylocapsa acidiphila TaxID=133552 RepID=UPI00042293B5|nr:TIGR02301 family protein [Methylocapsa acidiphila]
MLKSAICAIFALVLVLTPAQAQQGFFFPFPFGGEPPRQNPAPPHGQQSPAPASPHQRPHAKSPTGNGAAAKGAPAKGAQPKAGSSEAKKNEPPGSETPASEPPAAPYEGQLLRLAEILGSLSYLDELCGSSDAGQWRERMQALLDAEAKTTFRKERLAGAFNRGFRGYERSYRACTQNAQIVITRFLAEGGRLTHEIVSRFSAT